jgi:hypothetical protein
MIFVIVLNALRSVKKVYKTAGAENDKVEDGALEISLRSKTPLLASKSDMKL